MGDDDMTIKTLFGFVMLAVLSEQVGATSPPAPKALTIGEIVSMSEVVFLGRVLKVFWKEVESRTVTADVQRLGIGYIEAEVAISDLLFGDSGRLNRRVMYLIGRSPLSEKEAKNKYEGRGFIFMGNVERSPDSSAPSVQIAFPPSGREPLETDRLADVMTEVARRRGITGPLQDEPGTNRTK